MWRPQSPSRCLLFLCILCWIHFYRIRNPKPPLPRIRLTHASIIFLAILKYKKSLTEADIRTKFITPTLDNDKEGAWDLMTQLLEEHYFTNGRLMVRGKSTKRGQAKKADYILFHQPNMPIAVIEAKDNNHVVGVGMQQALVAELTQPKKKK